jgi:hypothetical protein
MRPSGGPPAAAGISGSPWLDLWGAAAHKRRDIAAWIMQEHDVGNWWAQTLNRTSQPGRSARFDWEGGDTRVNVGFTAKGKGTSQVALRHERLLNAKAAERMKAYWRERFVVPKALMKR